MANVHIILQGKGGVGKSFIAAMIAQYKLSKGQKPICVDTDPVNATFCGYKKLNVKKLEILEGDEINSRHFDTLIEMIATSGDEDIIIDNGASSFVPLSHYLITNDVPELLRSMGHEIIIHTVITGGQALLDTVAGFANLVEQYPIEEKFIVLLNPYWGAIEDAGKGFEQLKIYITNKARVSAIIHIPDLKEETFGRDLSEMLQAKQTFEEAIDAVTNTIMMRQRLKIIQKQIFGQMDIAAIL
jgi:anion-transporting  ArsA/GET3 family ATPase